MSHSFHQFDIDEIKRILDVARAVREEVDPVQREFNHDEMRMKLRDRLIAAGEISGSPMTEEEAVAAVDRYYENLYDYAEPTGFQAKLARLYAWVMSIGRPKQQA